MYACEILFYFLETDLHLVMFFHFPMAMYSFNILHLKIMGVFFKLMMQTERDFAIDQPIPQYTVASQKLISVCRSYCPFKKSFRSPTTEGARSSTWLWHTCEEKQQLPVEMCS